MRYDIMAHWTRTQPAAQGDHSASDAGAEAAAAGGLVLTGKAAVLKTAGLIPLGVRIPRPPPNSLAERWPSWLKAAAC